MSCDHLDLHVLPPSFPTRRSSDLLDAAALRAEVVGVVDHPGGQPENLLLQRLQHLQVAGLRRHGDFPLGNGTRQPKTTPKPPGMTCQRRHYRRADWHPRSEEHTSELQSLMRISYAVFCLKN